VRAAAAIAAALLLAGCGSTPGEVSLETARPDRDDPRLLVVSGIHGACDRLLSLEAEETASEVRLRWPVRTSRGSCTDEGIHAVGEVRLAAPLGDRVVRDATTGEPLTAP